MSQNNYIPPLEHLNTSELLDIIRRDPRARRDVEAPVYGCWRLRRSLPREVLIEIIQTGRYPEVEELAATVDSRKRLEDWIQQNFVLIESQLPCTGSDRGKCTRYPCSEGRHLDCFISARKHFL